MEKFFIVGCPRSGTTMVQQALNRHSQIVIPPETKYFFSFFGRHRKQQARHVERINADLHIDLPRPTRRVCSLPEGRAYYELMAEQYVQRRRAGSAAYFGEKTPEHTGQLSRIRQMFPDAKVLVLYRDGRDVASSLTRVPWMSSNLYVNFAVWLYYSWVIREELTRLRPNTYFARYEDIVAAPQQELAAILQFLGARYEPAVAEGYGNREGIPEREVPWKGRALQPITAERVSAYRRELTDDQIGALERLGREALPSLGYPLLTGGERPLAPAVLVSLACHLSALAYRLPWHALLRELTCRLFSGRAPERSAPLFPLPPVGPCSQRSPGSHPSPLRC